MTPVSTRPMPDGTVRHAAASAARVSIPRRLSYGIGSIAYGVKDNGFQTFLLLFYNQVMGLSAVTVGAVVMLALILDALVDPLIGRASDRTRSRIGRRHPWMYAAALPVSGGWLLLWNPPVGSQGLIAAWLFATAIMVRSAVSCYEVPSAALLADLTDDYDERTSLSAWRFLLGWVGGLGMTVAAYAVFLTPSAAQPNGLLNRAGYSRYALAGAVTILVAILVSAAGTQRLAMLRSQARTASHASTGTLMRELVETLRNPGFATLMLAGLCTYSAQGMIFGLATYVYGYVWGFGPGDFVWLTAVLLVGVVLAFAVAPRLTARFGKRGVATVCITVAPVILVTPYALRLLHLFPRPGEPALLPVLFASMILYVALSVTSMISGSAMLADLADQQAEVTGRQSAGLLFAGSFLVQKATGGIGIFLAGSVLTLAGFPAEAKPGSVPGPVLDRMTVIFGITAIILSVAAALLYRTFPFGREEHVARLARRDERAGV